MLKVFSFLSKREDIDTRAFIDYYENNQVASHEPGEMNRA
jgi:hypothetical protein